MNLIMKKELLQPHKPERHKKGWGYEDWISNNKKYCGKLLVFKKGKRCSFHYHKKKQETFFLFSGKLKIIVGWKNNFTPTDTKSYVLRPGDCMEIPRNLRHQMIALEDSSLFEFSTTHFEEDSKRIVRGD